MCLYFLICKMGKIIPVLIIPWGWLLLPGHKKDESCTIIVCVTMPGKLKRTTYKHTCVKNPQQTSFSLINALLKREV